MDIFQPQCPLLAEQSMILCNRTAFSPEYLYIVSCKFKMGYCHNIFVLMVSYLLDMSLSVPLKVWNQNGPNPYITYEYTVMRDSMASVSQPPIYRGIQGGSSLVSVEIGSVLHHNESMYDKAVPEMEGNQVQTTVPRAVEGQTPGQETNEVYKTANTDCEQDANTPVQYIGKYINLWCLYISGKKYLNEESNLRLY